VDKIRGEVVDYDNIAYPLVEFGWTINESITLVMYTMKDWLKYSGVSLAPYVGDYYKTQALTMVVTVCQRTRSSCLQDPKNLIEAIVTRNRTVRIFQ